MLDFLNSIIGLTVFFLFAIPIIAVAAAMIIVLSPLLLLIALIELSNK